MSALSMGFTVEPLGQRVRRLRTANGLSQQELAVRMRVSQPRISQIERGRTSSPLPLRTLYDLADGLGVELQALIGGDALYEQVAVEDAVEPQPPSPLVRSVAPLVGREEALAEVIDRLREGKIRVLTLTGPAGVGKTQLALHAIAELNDAYPDGIVTVPLAECDDAASVTAVVARALGLRERGARPLRQWVTSTVCRKRMLLLLDNVEQIAEPVSLLVAEILAACPHAALLVTSRAPLNLRDESRYEVLPLGLPAAPESNSLAMAELSPAVELLVQRARAVLPDFTLTDANVADVVEICRRLDGLPLAIELAAPRLRIFSPSQMLRQLERRLSLLTSTAPDLPARQRSLRGSVAWGVDLLSPDNKALFRRLSAFAGGFTLEAAVEMMGQFAAANPADARGGEAGGDLERRVALGLSTLLEQSLIVRGEQDAATPRFGMLQVVQEYAREKLARAGEEAACSQYHLTWCMALAERAARSLYRDEEAAWLRRLQREDANLQAALAWAFGPGRDAGFEFGLRLAGALTDYWFLCGRISEGRTWLTRAISLSARHAPSIGLARTLAGACLFEQAQAAIEPAQAHGEQALMLARMLGDQQTVGRALITLGNIAIMRGEYDHARSRHEEALAVYRRLGDQPWVAWALICLGADDYRQGGYESAVSRAGAALTIARAVGDRWDIGAALRLLGDVARERGFLHEAQAYFEESLASGWQYDSENEIADALRGLGMVSVAAGDFAQGARLLGAAETLYQRLGVAVPPPRRPEWPKVVERIRKALGDDDFARTWGSLTPEQAILNIRGLPLAAD